jgi:hypothetical protein
LYNSSGRVYQLASTGSAPTQLDTGFARRCNNDHGLSPDGKWLAISDQTQTGKSLIYIVPRVAARLGHGNWSLYWHGWSPDGSRLVYCAERGGEYDVYLIPAAGGDGAACRQRTDDGPEYARRQIHLLQLHPLRPHADLADAARWFEPGNDHERRVQQLVRASVARRKWIAMLSYRRDVSGHPENKPVRLRLLPTVGGEPRELVRLFGGQGTINVPSWSPDSRQFAFVSYELLPEK